MTASIGNLQVVLPYNGFDRLMVGNGHLLPITHIGTVTLSSSSSSIQLNDVLVVPNLHEGLLYVSKFTFNYALIFQFNESSFVKRIGSHTK